MLYTAEEVMDYVAEEDVKFIRLAFFDVFGQQKNISILPGELEGAFAKGVSFDASAIDGFGGEEKSDLFLFPDPGTLEVLPWRPSHGKVVRLYCDIRYPDGTPFEMDGRDLLRRADAAAREMGLSLSFGVDYEFYLFNTDEAGNPTNVPHDNAGYMDIAPDDKGENVRREICLTLEEMGLFPMSSHHQHGPGQHQINYRPASALRAADNAMTFMSAVRTVAARAGLHASFTPKPLTRYNGNGLHIHISFGNGDRTQFAPFLAGVMEHIRDMTAFLNPTRQSYERLGSMRAPRFITWSTENRAQLIRVPAAEDAPALELRSPDPTANPYIAFALLIHAGLDGVRRGLTPPPATDLNLYETDRKSGLRSLPATPEEAFRFAEISSFIAEVLPRRVVDVYRSSIF